MPTLRAPLKFGQSEDACSPILCPPHTLSLRVSIFIIPSKGVWGHCPMFTKALDLGINPLTFCPMPLPSECFT